MTRVRFSELALADLEDIAEYIGRDSAEAARRVINRLEGICFALGDFPEMGVLSEVPHARTLVVPDLRYKVIYEVAKKTGAVAILRVYHSSRGTRY